MDLISRSGNLEEAEATVMSSMPFAPDGAIWGTMLSSCMTHEEYEMGIRMGELAVSSDPGKRWTALRGSGKRRRGQER